MKLANVDGRAVLVTGDDQGIDVEQATEGKFGPDPASAHESLASAATAFGKQRVPAERNPLVAPYRLPVERVLFVGSLHTVQRIGERFDTRLGAFLGSGGSG